MKVLCLDIEGGYGGSSRSLFESIRHLSKYTDVEVWCRREGPIQASYEALGVRCSVKPDMPHVSSLPRLSRNIYSYGRFALQWRKTWSFRNELVSAARGSFDLVHFNHEGLFFLLSWLKSALGSNAAPLTMHIRTCVEDTVFGRHQYRKIARNADQLVFISENEQNWTRQLAGRDVGGRVIYNIVAPPLDVRPATDIANDGRFKIAVLSNYAWVRGIDRLIDVARELKRRDRQDVLFVIAGNMTLSRSLPGGLGEVARDGGDLASYAQRQGVASMFRFLGHIADPFPVLAACDALAKPSRERNPWGRDILEAMALGKPPITIGDYDRFVQNGVTGILHSEFDAKRWAESIIGLADERNLPDQLGREAKARVAELCDGRARAQDLQNFWSDTISAKMR